MCTCDLLRIVIIWKQIMTYYKLSTIFRTEHFTIVAEPTISLYHQLSKKTQVNSMIMCILSETHHSQLIRFFGQTISRTFSYIIFKFITSTLSLVWASIRAITLIENNYFQRIIIILWIQKQNKNFLQSAQKYSI